MIVFQQKFSLNFFYNFKIKIFRKFGLHTQIGNYHLPKFVKIKLQIFCSIVVVQATQVHASSRQQPSSSLVVVVVIIIIIITIIIIIKIIIIIIIITTRKRNQLSKLLIIIIVFSINFLPLKFCCLHMASLDGFSFLT